MMNQGDTVATTIRDTPQGLLASVTDFTTHQTGYIVASGKNGFMNTNYKTCAGTPFNFHPEYNTAKQQNQVPWAALEGGVLMEQEIGHFETCSSITNSYPYTASYPAARRSATRTPRRPALAGPRAAGRSARGRATPPRASARTRPPKVAGPARATTSPRASLRVLRHDLCACGPAPGQRQRDGARS